MKKKKRQKCIKVKWIFLGDATYTLWTYDYDDDEASFFAKRFSLNTFIRYDDAFLFIKTVELNFFLFFKASRQLSVKNECLYKQTNTWWWCCWWNTISKKNVRQWFRKAKLLNCFLNACLLRNVCLISNHYLCLLKNVNKNVDLYHFIRYCFLFLILQRHSIQRNSNFHFISTK